MSRILLILCLALSVVAAQASEAQNFPDVKNHSSVEASGNRVMSLSIVIAVPRDAVWKSIASAEGWRSWAAPNVWMDFRIGGIIESSYHSDARKGDPANIKNEIVSYVPRELLAFRNVQAPPGFQNAREFGEVATLIALRSRGRSSTEVTLTAVGFRPEPAFEALYEKFLWGNSFTMTKLKSSLEMGPVDWERLEKPKIDKFNKTGG
jgi:uncharacterized protein YndB with AHSA1/START domain